MISRYFFIQPHFLLGDYDIRKGQTKEPKVVFLDPTKSLTILHYIINLMRFFINLYCHLIVRYEDLEHWIYLYMKSEFKRFQRKISKRNTYYGRVFQTRCRSFCRRSSCNFHQWGQNCLEAHDWLPRPTWNSQFLIFHFLILESFNHHFC